MLGTNYSKNKIFRIHWKTHKANGGWKTWDQETCPSCFSFPVLAEPWATLCAGKSSNEIRTCDIHGCGHYSARRYVYHMLSGLLTSWPPCLVCLPMFPQVLMIISSDNRKTQRWNQLHYCLWRKFQELCFKYGLWIGNRVWNKEKRKGSKQCFPTVTYFTWFFQGENQASLSHFIDEELEPRHQRAKGPAKHSWRWWKLN